MDLKEKTIRLIDDLKATCQSYGLGNRWQRIQDYHADIPL